MIRVAQKVTGGVSQSTLPHFQACERRQKCSQVFFMRHQIGQLAMRSPVRCVERMPMVTETQPDTAAVRSAGLLSEGKHLPTPEEPRLQSQGNSDDSEPYRGFAVGECLGKSGLRLT